MRRHRLIKPEHKELGNVAQFCGLVHVSRLPQRQTGCHGVKDVNFFHRSAAFSAPNLPALCIAARPLPLIATGGLPQFVWSQSCAMCDIEFLVEFIY
jgi:hypothetical protein